LLVVVAVCSVSVLCGADFDRHFTGETFRLDYFHTGTAAEEHISVHRMRIEGPWPGSRTQLLDPTGLGKYQVEVADLKTGQVLYSRGFAGIFGEWETTGEARAGTFRTIEETVRFPEPRRPFQVRLRKRGADLAFREFWTTAIEPGSRFVDRAPVPEQAVWTVQDSGDPSVKVDLLILGDGYTAEERERFHQQVKQLSRDLLSVEPFKSRAGDFSIRAIDTVSAQSGVSRPRAGVFRNTPLRARYNSFDSERYVLTLEEHAWRDVAAAAPYDAVVILVNERQYGGGGIFNLSATAAAGSGFNSYLMIHEFGHSFAGLADEYYTSDVAYEEWTAPDAEPYEPNITALLSPGQLKWRDLVDSDTPLPTPWGKEEYEKASRASQQKRREMRAAGAPEEDLEALFREERELFTRMLGDEEYAGKVGAFEGAGYEAKGLYRPAADCIMFTRDEVGFCPVCARAISRILDLHTR
jgi:hypothetical protein